MPPITAAYCENALLIPAEALQTANASDGGSKYVMVIA